jgi:photosystem II stability/assembly factor-like uncharacterized protein
MARFTHLLRPAQAAGLAIGASIMLFASPTALGKQPEWTASHWEVTELKPNIKEGGRANTIAVHPTNNDSILVASESGGLFKSEDHGNTWQHVDSLPVFYTNAVAFVDPEIVIVSASEDFSSTSNRGGIWRSENGGASWKQVLWKDAIGQLEDGTLTPNPDWPCGPGQRLSAYEISIAPGTGNIYVADRCGVSISSDLGKSWKHVDPFQVLVDRRVLSVVALRPQAALSEDIVLAGGPAGIRRSVDGGIKWEAPTTSPSPAAIWDIHAFERSPLGDDNAYVVAEAALDENQQNAEKNLSCRVQGATCGYMILYETSDGGDTWKQLYIAPGDIWRPGGGACGGIAFVKEVIQPPITEPILYVSNRCAMYAFGHSLASFYSGDKGYPPLLGWTATLDAGDTRDIAFDNQNKPILAATDHGLIKPPDGGPLSWLSTSWTFAGADNKGNIPNGFNALQIYEVKGQWIGNYHNLYFGTQDNALWSSDDSGNTWTRCCSEGKFFEGQYRVATSSHSQITFDSGTRYILRGPLFSCPADQNNLACLEDKAGIDKWLNPKLQGEDCRSTDAPTIVKRDFHVQGVEWVLGGLSLGPGGVVLPSILCAKGLAVTDNLGLTWEQYATFNYDRFDLPKLSFPKVRQSQLSFPKIKQSRPVLYQAIHNISHPLARIVGEPCPDPSPRGCVTYPDMEACPATNTCPIASCPDVKKLALGTGPTMEWRYRVFAVDPGDVDHLIAPDLNSGTMMETRDGGDCWAEIKQLTDLIKDGGKLGKLNFSGRKFFNGNGDNGDSLQASAISFNPEHPDMVAVGTVQNGIFISSNGGQDWAKVPGSERATLISSLHWRKADELIVSTYGRGLWRVRFINVGLVADFKCKSPDCFHIYVQRSPEERPSPYDQAALAFGGSIEGARIADGILQELFIQPGTSISFLSDAQDVPDIKVTETERPMGFLGIESVPTAPKENGIISGLTLRRSGKGSELVGFVFARSHLFMEATEAKDLSKERPVGRKEPTNAGEPYLELPAGPETGPGTSIPLSGRNLEAGSTIEITMDGRTVRELVVAQDGRFYARVKAPTRFGLYRITIVDGTSRKALDSAELMVRPHD